MLAEVAAKRQILRACEAWTNTEPLHPGDMEDRAYEGAEQWTGLQVLLMLAQPYAGRPGWRAEWAAGGRGHA